MLAGAPCSICRASVELAASEVRGAAWPWLLPERGEILHHVGQARGGEDRDRLGRFCPCGHGQKQGEGKQQGAHRQAPMDRAGRQRRAEDDVLRYVRPAISRKPASAVLVSPHGEAASSGTAGAASACRHRGGRCHGAGAGGAARGDTRNRLDRGRGAADGHELQARLGAGGGDERRVPGAARRCGQGRRGRRRRRRSPRRGRACSPPIAGWRRAAEAAGSAELAMIADAARRPA